MTLESMAVSQGELDQCRDDEEMQWIIDVQGKKSLYRCIAQTLFEKDGCPRFDSSSKGVTFMECIGDNNSCPKTAYFPREWAIYKGCYPKYLKPWEINLTNNCTSNICPECPKCLSHSNDIVIVLSVAFCILACVFTWFMTRRYYKQRVEGNKERWEYKLIESEQASTESQPTDIRKEPKATEEEESEQASTESQQTDIRKDPKATDEEVKNQVVPPSTNDNDDNLKGTRSVLLGEKKKHDAENSRPIDTHGQPQDVEFSYRTHP